MLFRVSASVLFAALICSQPGWCEDAVSEGGSQAKARYEVVVRVQGPLGAAERVALFDLLGTDFERRGLRLNLEVSAVDVRAWLRQRATKRVLLIAILDVQNSGGWRLSIVDAARSRAISRVLPGGVEANAAALEAVASIISSAASALDDGLEVASLSVDEVVAPKSIEVPAPAKALFSQSAPVPSPMLGVRSSLSAVASSFTAEAPVQLGFSAALSMRLETWNVRVLGVRYLPVEIGGPVGSFNIERTAFAAAFGRSCRWRQLELELDAVFELELLRRVGARSAIDSVATADRSLHRSGPGLDLRGRYILGKHFALETLVGGYYFVERVRFLAEAPGSDVLAQPWSWAASAQFGVEVRAP